MYICAQKKTTGVPVGADSWTVEEDTGLDRLERSITNTFPFSLITAVCIELEDDGYDEGNEGMEVVLVWLVQM
jgi:hypothetical protein